MKIIIILSTIVLVSSLQAWSLDHSSSLVRYQSNFGLCPAKSTGSLTLRLMKIFEETNSLRKVKKEITNEKLDKRHFLSSYKIDYDPLKRLVKFHYNCPKPLMKVQVYRQGGLNNYDAILVENGHLYDPTYEVLLRQEAKLTKELPFLAMPVEELDKQLQYDLANLFKKMDESIQQKISEIIISDKSELTMILSFSSGPLSVFLGDDQWEMKVNKLEQIVSYMEKKQKIPSVVNMTNLKKIVVKFNDSI